MATIDMGVAKDIASQKEKQYGLPEGTLFKMSGIESSFNKDAVSPKGAKGYFQFMPDTAKAYGLDDPTHFEKSADAAGRYMSDNLKKYNGNMDLALADYNGGPKAAKALASGKPWDETKGYLEKFYGHVVAPMSPQFTSTKAEGAGFGGPDSSERMKMEAQNADENGGFLNSVKNIPSAVATGFELDNSVFNYYKTKALEHTDPNFSWTKENTQQYTLDAGVPEKHWDYILQAKSDQEAQARLGRVQESMQKEEKLAKMGVAGIGGRMVGSLVDLPTLLSFVPAVGGTAMLTNTSRIANALRMGLITGGTNVAFDAVANQYKPLATEDDLYASALAGIGLGAIGGGAINPKNIVRPLLAAEAEDLSRVGLSQYKKFSTAEFEREGYVLTEEGRKAFALDQDKANQAWKKNTARELERDIALWKKRFYEDRPQNEQFRTQLMEEVEQARAVPVYDRGRVTQDLYGAEHQVQRGMHYLGAVKNDMSVEDFISKHMTFGKNGEVKAVSREATVSGLNAADLKAVGLSTKEELENYLNSLRANGNHDGLLRFAQKDSTFSILDRIKANGTHAEAALANRLREQLLDDLPIHHVRQKDIDMTFGGEKSRYAGFYSRDRHAMFVRKDARNSLYLHEIAHAATVLKIEYGLKNPASVHGQLVKEIDDIYQQALAVAKQQGYKSYYLKNIKEFTAGLYTADAKSFHNFLAKISADGQENFVSKFLDVIRRMFGLGEQDFNALVKAMGLTDKLVGQKLNVEADFGKVLGKQTIHFMDTPGVPKDTVEAANKAGLNVVFGWGLGLEHRLGGAGVPQAVRNLAAKLFGTTVGYKGHGVVRANAWDDTTMLAEGWAVKMRKGSYPAFEQWFKESGQKFWQKGEAFDNFGTQVSDYIRGVEGDYSPHVVKAGDSIRKVLAEVVDHINNPAYSDGGSKMGLTMREIRDPKTGLVTVEGMLEKNPFYLPRKHDINKWHSMTNAIGRDGVEGWWARAYRSGREDVVSEELANKWAKWYVFKIEEANANRNSHVLDNLLNGQDQNSLKMSLMENGGFSEDEALKIIQQMIPTKSSDKGALSSNLKHRNTVNERYKETVTKSDGTSVEVGINDFIHANAFDVVEPYFRRTAANVALAKHLDIYKLSDIDQMIEDAVKIKLGDGTSGADLKKVKNDLKFAFDRIQGLPQEDFSKFNKSMEMWRNFNVIRLMGGTVFNQAVEYSQIVGSMGWKATNAAVKELQALSRDIKTGKAPHYILDHLENVTGGAGAEFVKRMEFSNADDWVRNAGDTLTNSRLDKLDTGMKKASAGVLDATGMTGLMVQQKRIHSIALVNHFMDVAQGKLKSEFLTADRLAWMGLDNQDAAAVFKALKDYSKSAKGEFSTGFKIDFEKWVKDSPETHSKFMTAIHRESRRVVQENDLASMVPIMGSTLGKTVFQFMNFTMHGWNKSLMFGANHRDWSTLSTVLHGSLFASLAYMGRTMLQAQGMDGEQYKKFMDQRMSPKQIVANSFGRISQVSLLPNLYDTLSPWPMFQGMRTTSDLSSLASNPTYQAINGVLSLKNIVRNAASDELQTTQRDVKAWGKLLPLNNVVPVSTLLNSIANDFPTSEKQQ